MPDHGEHDARATNGRDPHGVLDQLLADGPIVMFSTEIVEPGNPAVTSAEHFSSSLEPVLGYRRDEVGDGFWLSCVHPDDRDRVIASRAEAITDDSWPTRNTYRFRHADGRYRWIESVVNRVAGDPVAETRDRLVGFVTDVTEQYEADLAVRARERRLTQMFDGAPAQIYAKDLDGRYLLVNRDVLALWGLTSDQVVGRSDHDLWPEFADAYRANDQLVAEAGIPLVSDEVVTLDGEVATYLSLKFPLRDDDGTIYATAGVSADISDRARSIGALRAAKEAADRANLAKSEFLSRMSHELRTPLNSILGFGQLLELASLEADDRESVSHILRAGRHLLDLIDEVLDIAKIEAGRLTMSIEPVDLAEVVAEGIALIAPTARERAVVLSTDLPEGSVHVLADRQRLLQVLLNLLSNAIKYNRRGGMVHVEVNALDPDADEPAIVRLGVRDSGRGIAPEHHERVFEAFERLDAAGAGIEGTGVGLALTKHLVELMGGQIGVASTLGAGATFWVDLIPGEPGAVAFDAPASSGQLAPSEGGGLRVLYIEDNLTNLALVERVLALRPGTTLLTALQGSIGIELALRHHPDLILLDLHLPDLPGREVLARLHAEPETAAIPVVVVTADATAGQRTRLLREGARHYLTKPIDVRELLQVIDGVATSLGRP